MSKTKLYILQEVIGRNCSAPAFFEQRDDAVEEMLKRLAAHMQYGCVQDMLKEDKDKLDYMAAYNILAFDVIEGRAAGCCPPNGENIDLQIFEVQYSDLPRGKETP